MASSARGSQPIHQDFIARIRYSNTLPPPPNPPRLLDIPNTGLAGGQYTAPGFASRLAREQPLNIEADAELGMPLNLVGMPGIFDGDESSIQAPLVPPAIHPHDKALLRSLAALSKPKFADDSVSFLRRTEYITAASKGVQRYDDNSNALLSRPRARKARPALDRESPEFIKNQIAKSFDVAAAVLRDNGKRVVHPTRAKEQILDQKTGRQLKIVGTFPLIPDLEAFNGVGGYIEVKFGKHPSLKDTYDSRLEVGMLRPLGLTESQKEERARMLEAYQLDPTHNVKPPGEDDYDYEFYLPPTEAQGEAFKRKFDPRDLMHNDDTLYPATRENEEGETEGIFKYEHVRTYETRNQTGGVDSRYDEELILSVDDTGDRQRACYYYPVVSRLNINPRRNKNMARKFQSSAEDDELPKTDYLEIQVTDPSEETAADRSHWGDFNAEKEDGNAATQATQDDDEDGHGEPDDEIPSQLSVQGFNGENGAEGHSQG